MQWMFFVVKQIDKTKLRPVPIFLELWDKFCHFSMCTSAKQVEHFGEELVVAQWDVDEFMFGNLCVRT